MLAEFLYITPSLIAFLVGEAGVFEIQAGIVSIIPRLENMTEPVLMALKAKIEGDIEDSVTEFQGWGLERIKVLSSDKN